MERKEGKEGEKGGLGVGKTMSEEGNKGYSWPGVVTHTFNPITLEAKAEAGGSLSWEPTWSTSEFQIS